MNLTNIEKNNFLVTQSNQLVEANYSSNLTTTSYKVANLIMALINPKEDYKSLSVTVSVNDLKRYLGWSEGTKWNRFYKDLKEISKRLNQEPIEIITKGEKIDIIFFLASSTLDLKKGEVTFRLSPDLLPHLTHLKKNFTTYQLEYVAALKSSYAFRLYALFRQYLKIGTRKFELSDFKKKIGAPDKYKYNDVKKRVILPAQAQLKENTNIAFIYKEIKAGRSVTGLEFVIFSNTPSKKSEQIELDFLNEYIEETETPALSDIVIQGLNQIGISEQNIVKYLTQGFEIIADIKQREAAKERCKTLEAYYLEKLELTKNSTSKENAAGFLIKALKENWTKSKRLEQHQNKEAVKNRKEAERKLKILEARMEKLTKEKKAINKPIIETLIADDDILKMAYDATVNKYSILRKQLPTHLPIQKQYHESALLRGNIEFELMERFPKKFAEGLAIGQKIKTIQNEIKALKKENIGL